jgi:hypothetical protein
MKNNELRLVLASENAPAEVTEERVEIKRSGCNVTWIFRNCENEDVQVDMSFIRADTIAALLKRSVNLGQTEEMKPRHLQCIQTEVHVYPSHSNIVFDQNPKLSLVRSPEQVTALIKDLEELAA